MKSGSDYRCFYVPRVRLKGHLSQDQDERQRRQDYGRQHDEQEGRAAQSASLALRQIPRRFDVALRRDPQANRLVPLATVDRGVDNRRRPEDDEQDDEDDDAEARPGADERQRGFGLARDRVARVDVRLRRAL